MHLFADVYETFDHTADVGLRIRAATLPGLFAEAGRGLFSLIVEDLEAVVPRTARTVRVPPEALPEQLFDWLAELLYIFDAQGLVLRAFEVDCRTGGVTGVCRGEPYDPDRHGRRYEVKAVTYHGLKVEETPRGYEAEVILDI